MMMTHFKNHRGCKMNTQSITRLVASTIALLLAAGLFGCDANQQRLAGAANNGEQTAEQPTGDDEGGSDEKTPPIGPTDEHGHGTDPSVEGDERIAPGFMNGSWRVATTEQDTPVAYLDTFQDKGEARVDGTYLMAIGIYERLDGETGDLQEATLDGDTLTVTWNPTNDQTELFTLQAQKVDENTFEGRITAERNPELDLLVQVTRRNVE